MSIKRMKSLSKNRRVLGSIGVVTLIFTVLSGCTFLPKEEPVLAPPLTEPAQLDYKTVEVKKGEIIKSVKGVGTLVPKNNVDLYYSKDGGRLKELKVSKGDTVEKGQVLAELETGDLAYEAEQARLDLRKAEIRLQQLRAEQETNTYEIEIAKLEVQSMNNRSAQLNNKLAEARIVSPLNGVVTFVDELHQGEVVTAYQSIFQVAEITELQLQYQAVNAVDLSDVELGMEAVIAIEDKKLKGEVVQTPKTVPLDISQKDPDFYGKTIVVDIKKLPEDVKVGDMIDFEVITAKKDNTLILPINGLRSIAGRNYVQLIADNTKREVDIEVGIKSSTEVEVLKGLEEGDQVIVK
ncbi:efflux RND transporter periplasmic adaptor subunit [Lederbergia sp. NSJ-179]|uniref:efflux RND transporter periplasmic adaptor subunit n=1 Tax=Lederbergia sp. NSJ-179 TaxID=2931402 RepID=UPI001FD5D0A3|nr:efflux RND transporter periplasmic adaptor subunit [Lederbergia sp. NSJ-179]MCJ7841300.1 efflux RND transporter periplasmic adaptor subunit [Lederbergia sp. NSJ-179]